jgi:hypothetical protein
MVSVGISVSVDNNAVTRVPKGTTVTIRASCTWETEYPRRLWIAIDDPNGNVTDPAWVKELYNSDRPAGGALLEAQLTVNIVGTWGFRSYFKWMDKEGNYYTLGPAGCSLEVYEPPPPSPPPSPPPPAPPEPVLWPYRERPWGRLSVTCKNKYPVNPADPLSLYLFDVTLESEGYSAVILHDVTAQAIPYVPIGTHSVTCKKEWFKPQTLTDTWNYDQEVKYMNFVLEPEYPPPPPFIPHPWASIYVKCFDADTKEKLYGFRVYIDDKWSVWTDSWVVNIPYIPPGTHSLRIEKIGYNVWTGTAYIAGDLQGVVVEAYLTKITISPLASIEDVEAPSIAGSGESIQVKVKLKNTGIGTGKLVASIIDRDNGQIVGAQTETPSLSPGQSASLVWDLTMPAKVWKLRAEAGH